MLYGFFNYGAMPKKLGHIAHFVALLVILFLILTVRMVYRLIFGSKKFGPFFETPYFSPIFKCALKTKSFCAGCY